MAKRREPTAAAAPVELKLDIPEGQAHVEVGAPEIPPEQPLPARYNPVPMEPGTPEAVMNNLLVREISDPSGPLEPISRTIGTLQYLVHGLTEGTEITGIRSEITRISQHQPEKIAVFNAAMNLIDMERAADAAEIRGGVEKILKRSVRRGDLSTGEALVLLKYSNGVIQEVRDRVTEETKGVDTVTVIEKVDYTQQHVEKSVQQKWEGTSPQGREIIRKKLFELKKTVQTTYTIPAAQPT
jgi:hypothetical protein